MNESSIPAELRELVNAELIGDETIRWIDQPIPYFFSAAAVGMFVFGIPWTFISLGAFSVACVGDFESPQNFGARPLLVAFLIPFVLIGLGMLFAPLWMHRSAKRTVYAITNHRAIIIRGIFFAYNVTSYYPSDLWYLARKQKNNGTGNIRFPIERGGSEALSEPGFMNIRNVRDVERILQELKGTK